MMYLILPTQEALTRNNQEAVNRGCQAPTIYWWSMTELGNGTTALAVDDGDGLSEEELAMCVTEINNTNNEV